MLWDLWIKVFWKHEVLLSLEWYRSCDTGSGFEGKENLSSGKLLEVVWACPEWLNMPLSSLPWLWVREPTAQQLPPSLAEIIQSVCMLNILQNYAVLLRIEDKELQAAGKSCAKTLGRGKACPLGSMERESGWQSGGRWSCKGGRGRSWRALLATRSPFFQMKG